MIAKSDEKIVSPHTLAVTEDSSPSITDLSLTFHSS